MPPAIKSLRAHLGDGDPNAWRAALRVFEHAFGRPQELATPTDDRPTPGTCRTSPGRSWQIMAARVLELPAGETAIATTNTVPLVVANGTVE